LPSAVIKIETGNAKDYIDIIGNSLEYKRSRVDISEKGRSIKIEVEAEDTPALLASMQSAIRRMRIVANAEALFGR
jgi:tRNA threonylcarbamoyladenosine modification (KEOPS) complex  Pcc1 subunit